jgi:hypothetical protein
VVLGHLEGLSSLYSLKVESIKWVPTLTLFKVERINRIQEWTESPVVELKKNAIL